MNKRKFKSLSSERDEFVFFFTSRRFKKFKTKSISHIDILSDENDKFFSSFNEFQSSTKNVDFYRNTSIIARPNLKEFIKDQN